ncbi:MAG: cobalamin-dependent protein [Candidatus Cloacimonadales bacterium]
MNRKQLATLMRMHSAEITLSTTKKIYQRKDNMDAKQQLAQQKSQRDLGYLLNYLIAGLENNSPKIFLDYIDLSAVIVSNFGLSSKKYSKYLGILHFAIYEVLRLSEQSELDEMISAAQERLRHTAQMESSFINPTAANGKLAQKYLNLLLAADRHSASQLILQEVKAGTEIKDIYDEVFLPVQYEVGRLWQTNKISVAQEHFVSAATQMIMSQLYPYLFQTPRNGKKVIAAAVGNELHEIGIRMVSDYFEMAGWDSYFLGAQTPQTSIISSIKELQPEIVALATTISFHLQDLEKVIHEIKQLPLPPKIIVGGYPFNLDRYLWQKIGADAFAPDANSALEMARGIVC